MKASMKWLTCLAGTTMIVGCAQNKMTRQNWDMIKEGTSAKDEVRMTLGAPEVETPNQWEFEDEDKHLHATIHFDDRGVVTRKEWMDGKSGDWDGAAPGIKTERQGQPVSESKSNTTIKKD